MKKIILLFFTLASTVSVFAQKALVSPPNEDVSIGSPYSFVLRKDYSLEINIEVFLGTAIFRGFYFNGHKLEKKKEEIVEAYRSSAPKKVNARYFVLYGLKTPYSIYEASRSNKPLNEHLILKYSKNKKMYSLEIPLEALQSGSLKYPQTKVKKSKPKS